LLKNHDLEKWVVTNKLLIETGSTPHSHPVLTLNTRYVDDDGAALAVFLHEQIHWILSRSEERLNEAILELEELFPRVPTKPPRGASGKHSTYLHLIVNLMEFQALKEIVGPIEARSIIEKEGETHYSWIYKTVPA
jgi:hypothetical protein